MANLSPGEFFCAHSFIASTPTPPYGPGSPHTRTVPVLPCARTRPGVPTTAAEAAVVLRK